LDRINVGGGAHLVANRIASRHRSISDVSKTVSNSGSITIAEHLENRITTTPALHWISRNECRLQYDA
jgi:hypothetical protein